MEASLGLFLFLMFFICILYFYQIMNLELKVQTAIDQTARLQAAYYTAGDSEKQEISFAGCQLNCGFAKAYSLKLLSSSYLNASWVKGGSSGLSFKGSEFLKDKENIDLKVQYKVRIPFFTGISFTIKQHARRRIWIGDDSSSLTDTENMVYITPNGVVYHLYADCSYIKINPKAVAGSKIGLLRNESGGCYYPCEWCDPSDDGTVYITDYGTRYHSSASCSAIDREVETISLSEAGSRRLCSKCAKRSQE